MVELYYQKAKSTFKYNDMDIIKIVKDSIQEFETNDFDSISNQDNLIFLERLALTDAYKTLQTNHLLLSTSLLFHSWEQQFVRSSLRIINKLFKNGENVCITKMGDCIRILEKINLKIKQKNFYKDLDELRLLVNTIKHGQGSSANQLKNIKPEFFTSIYGEDISSLEVSETVFSSPYPLNLKESDFERYLKAIRSFWAWLPSKLELSHAQCCSIKHSFLKKDKRF
jgi:hypothetical protein